VDQLDKDKKDNRHMTHFELGSDQTTLKSTNHADYNKKVSH